MSNLLGQIANFLRTLHEKGAVYIVCGTFLTKIAAFLGSIVLIRLMIKGEYGVLSYMENLYTYAYIFAGYGLNNAVFRYIVLKDSKEKKAGVFDYVIKRGTLFNLVLVAVLAIIAFFYPHQEEFSVAAFLLPMMLLAIPLQFVFDSGTYSLRALFANKAYALFALFAVCLAWVLKLAGAIAFGLDGAVLSWPLTYLVMAIAVYIFVRFKVLGNAIAITVEGSEKKEINKYSLQYMVTNGLWAMFIQNDILLLGMMTGNSVMIATYKVAYIIPAAMAIFSSAIGIFVAPYFVKNENNKTWVWKNYLRILLVSVAGMGMITAVMCLAAEPIVIFMYGEQYLDAVGVMIVLLVAVFLNNAVRYTAANLLAAMGKIKINLVVSLLGMIVQIILDCVLIPQFGMYGCAYTSIAVYAFMAIAITAVFVGVYKPMKGKSKMS